MVECPQGASKCIHGLENNTANGDVVLTAFKTCYVPVIPGIACTKNDHLLTSSNYILRFSTDCTNNLAPFEVPPWNNTLNGYKCPDCYNTSSDDCNSEKEIECTGRQTECLHFWGMLQRPGRKIRKSVVKGCVTSESCSLAKFLPGTKARVFSIECSPALRSSVHL
nr:sodefrin precursor-like factor beta 3 [Eurycea tynerensis]